MSVQRTDQWLMDYVKQSLRSKDPYKLHSSLLCEKIACCFQDAEPHEVQQHLIAHGMFPPMTNINKSLQTLVKKKCWEIIDDEYCQLKREWGGPELNIYIFPSNQNVRLLRHFFKGKSGLAYPDGLFLFVSSYNSENEWRALLTHEYHHAYYLSNCKRQVTLLDAILMEGMAEHAVLERYGKDLLAPWTSIYRKEDSQRIWKKYLKSAHEMTPDHPEFLKLMYGGSRIPKWAGYAVGFELVSSYIENNPIKAKKLIEIPKERFLEKVDWV